MVGLPDGGMNQIVIGERVGGEAPVGVALDAARAETAEVVLKQEIAHGVATLGVVQPIIEASVTTDVSSAATARGSRKRDSRHSAVPALNEEFPINECEVYVPHGRAGKITHHTWELVIGHTCREEDSLLWPVPRRRRRRGDQSSVPQKSPVVHTRVYLRARRPP